jgi:hypothetical protein
VVARAGRRWAAGLDRYPIFSTLRGKSRRKPGLELVALILPGKCAASVDLKVLCPDHTPAAG